MGPNEVRQNLNGQKEQKGTIDMLEKNIHVSTFKLLKDNTLKYLNV